MKLKIFFTCAFIYITASCVTGPTQLKTLVKPLKEKRTLTTSVIIPCVARHFFLLTGLLESYQNQTILPDEIVISISEAEKLNPKHIAALNFCEWGFKLKIISNKGVIYDEPNRTIAMDNSSGSLLIFSDADDIVHPQRVELAKFVFENYDVDYLLHRIGSRKELKQPLDINDIMPVLRFTSLDDLLNNYAYPKHVPITTGSPCFLRKVADKIKWHMGTTNSQWAAGGDYTYCAQVCKLFKNTVATPLPLILYRSVLSSHGPTVKKICEF